ncbi:MAG TPA: hypothetical protein VMU17_05325, partial [Elusimicrobiota bacterium]|nr:hypothetical protein [Elusimicrobiota bacterium]
LINLACYVLPVAVWISCGFDFRAARPAWRWLAFLAFVCVSLESEGLAYSALRVHVDAPALMWSTLAMGVLRSRLPARRSLAVAFAALAALTKQTFIPVWLLALPFGSGLADERPLDRRLLMYTAFSAVGAVIVLRLFAPVNNLISDLVMLQTKYPFVDRPLASLILAFSDFVRQFWPLAAVVTFGILVDASDALRRNSILMIAAFVVFPIALVHRAKVGGDVNAFAPVLYWLLAASLFGLLRAISQEETGAHFPARVAKIILVLTVAMGSLECLPVAMHFRLIQARRILPLNPQESAYRYLRQHADGYYFPFNPLAAVMAEGRLYHTASSLADFTLQGHPLGPHDLQAGLPPVFSGVAIHESNDQDREALLHALDLRAQPVRDPAMPGWLIYVTGSDRRVR